MTVPLLRHLNAVREADIFGGMGEVGVNVGYLIHHLAGRHTDIVEAKRVFEVGDAIDDRHFPELRLPGCGGTNLREHRHGLTPNTGSPG